MQTHVQNKIALSSLIFIVRIVQGRYRLTNLAALYGWSDDVSSSDDCAVIQSDISAFLCQQEREIL
jgi:hypothetical protein